jgi:hypothetical protein
MATAATGSLPVALFSALAHGNRKIARGLFRALGYYFPFGTELNGGYLIHNDIKTANGKPFHSSKSSTNVYSTARES